MHISEGILTAPVLAAGAAATIVGVGYGLSKIQYERIPQVAVLASAFFVASLIHIPIGVSSVHLVLNGLTGILLGWAGFPAIAVGLGLQALLFQFGGITTLGVNTVNMAAPAVACYYVFGKCVRHKSNAVALVGAYLCGFMAVLLGTLMVALSLCSAGESFIGLSKMYIAAHIPVMVIEGTITAFCIRFLRRVKPEILEVSSDA